MTGLAPAEALILACVRHPILAADAELRQLTAGFSDWERFLEHAFHNRLIPLVARRFSFAGVTIPAPWSDHLTASLTRNALRNLRRTAELSRVLAGMAEAKIPALPYKGPALAADVYGDVSMRSFADLDVIVQSSEAEKARSFLLANGYHDRFQLTPARRRAMLRSQMHFQLFNADESVYLELHWALAPAYFCLNYSSDNLFRNPRIISMGGTEVSVPAVEDLLFALCVHGGKDFWERLVWVVDVARLIETQPEMDWEKVWQIARSAHAERLLLTGLHLAVTICETTLPAQMARRINADPSLTRLAARVAAGWWQTSGVHFSTLKSASLHLALRERLRTKMGYVLGYAAVLATPTKKEWDWLPLPDRLFFLYYWLRPLRLVWIFVFGARMLVLKKTRE